MTDPLSFQNVILRLQQFWAERGCLLWQPYNVQVGAGTMNPATFLHVLGPEPWNVAYVEPSVRPDDGRYGDNPNRMQVHYQFQVILKPDPGNPQELYLQSLEAIGIDRREHDIRFVEDNWQSPALGAWGLGWEVWLDGQEITQFTYFQQAGGIPLNPVSVEITYGLERITMALQGVDSVWEIDWGNGYRYGDALLQSEIEHCIYYFEVADVDGLRGVFETYAGEADRALSHEPPLVMPAHDYVLKCSHLFNVLDTRGAIGVVERAEYFRRMQGLAARVARAYVEQRKVDAESGALIVPEASAPSLPRQKYPASGGDFLLEIGVEELPVVDLASAVSQLRNYVMGQFERAQLVYNSNTDDDPISSAGTPRRLAVYVTGLQPMQQESVRLIKGPPVKAAFDVIGKPTQAAVGFAQKNGVEVSALERREIEGSEYVVAVVRDKGRPTAEVLAGLMPDLMKSFKFEQSMRWNSSGISFSRPIRWIVALYGDGVIPFTFAGVESGRITRGSRFEGSPEIEVKNATDYFKAMEGQKISLDSNERRNEIKDKIEKLIKNAGGDPDTIDGDLLYEVANLVEQPVVVLGHFDKQFLSLPEAVLTTVMKKHQRYFSVRDKKAQLLPSFIAVCNGDYENVDTVRAGNEHVIRARFADARFFYQADTQRRLADFLPDLKKLTFQEQLGSYYDKSARLEGLAARIGGLLGLSEAEQDTAIRAARLCKADLASRMVVELTSLQGIMGCEYALLSGESAEVAQAVAEQYQPRSARDFPQSKPGIVLALADRLDSLVGLMGVGLEATGSSDPYGLRRAAWALVEILIWYGQDFDLREAIRWTAEAQPVTVSEDAQTAVLDFIAGRLAVALGDPYRGGANPFPLPALSYSPQRNQIIRAVVNVLAHNPHRASVNVDQLAETIKEKDDKWSSILDAYARCVRITRDLKEHFTLRREKFTEPVEKALLAAYQKAAKALGDSPDVDQFIAAFEPLVEPISAFFAPAAEGGVLVMDQDKAVRENRLALLQHIVALGAGTADYSQLEGF